MTSKLDYTNIFQMCHNVRKLTSEEKHQCGDCDSPAHIFISVGLSSAHLCKVHALWLAEEIIDSLEEKS